MNIKTRTTTIHELDYKYFENLIHSNYGGNFNFKDDLLRGEPYVDYYETGLINKKELDEYEQEDLNGYLEGSYGDLIDSFLQDLINKDLLPQGEYIIK